MGEAKKHVKYDDAVKTYSPAKLRECHDQALTYYIDNGGEVSVKVLSRMAKVPQSYVRKWIKDEDWDRFIFEDEGDKIKLSPDTKDFIKSSAEKYGLSEQEELFCYHYLKNMNSTQAAMRAGYSSAYAYNKGYLLLNKPHVQAFLKEARSHMCEELFLDPLDILRQWAKIAFADMNDFVSVSGAGVMLRNSNVTDGQLITKIKEGKDGVTVELADRMKAMDRLSSYLQILPQDKANQIKMEILKKASSGEGDEPLRIEIVGV